MKLGFWKGLGKPFGVGVGSAGGAGASDTTAPTVVITANAATITAAAFTATFTFSEAVTGFTLGDITVANGSAGTFGTTSASVYTAVITPTTVGTVTVDVAGSVCTDAAGNNNTAATQFSILSLVGAAMWQKAGTQSYQDTGATILADDDAELVGFQNDQGGNNNDLTRINDDGYRATLKLNILNGNPVLRFASATPDAYSFPSTILSATGYYWFVVAKLADNADAYPILSENDGTRRGVLYATTTNFEVRHYTGAAYVAGGQQVAVDTNAHVFTLEHTGSAVNLYVDGVIGSGDGTLIISSTVQKRLGAGTNIGPLYLNGDVAEVICYIGTLTEANRLALEGYLTAKFF